MHGFGDKKHILLSKASKLIPGNPHQSTPIRWHYKGLGPNGVRLEAWRVGGRKFTSEEAIRRFFDRLNADRRERAPTCDTVNSAVDVAERELDEEWGS